MDILDTISRIIIDVLDEEDLVITRETTAEDAEDWDSLAQIQIIDAIEKELAVKFNLPEIEQLNQAGNVGDTVDLISRKLAAA
jgi:acyl carrier protein